MSSVMLMVMLISNLELKKWCSVSAPDLADLDVTASQWHRGTAAARCPPPQRANQQSPGARMGSTWLPGRRFPLAFSIVE